MVACFVAPASPPACRLEADATRFISSDAQAIEEGVDGVLAAGKALSRDLGGAATSAEIVAAVSDAVAG